MRKSLLLGLVLILGLGTGGAGALAVNLVIADRQTKAREASVFVATGTIMAPLAFPDGRLAGYASFEAEIEVSSEGAPRVRKEMPLLLDAVNMRTYRTPLASGPDGMIPGVGAFRSVLFEAAVKTFGQETVRRAVVTQATPA